MGRRDVDAIGGFSISGLLISLSSSVAGSGVGFFWLAGPNFADRLESPEMTGGGNSIPSAAFLDNCLAKSEACHHSKNFRANMLVGSKIFKLLSNLGPIKRGLKMDVKPKLLPPAVSFGASNSAMAL